MSSTINREKIANKRGKAFFFTMIVFLLLLVNNFLIDGFLVSIMNTSMIPLWYIILLFGVNIFTLLSLIGIYLFRKFCIYSFPIFVILHFVFRLHYLETFMYTDIFALFFFVGIGLVIFIPKWSLFK